MCGTEYMAGGAELAVHLFFHCFLLLGQGKGSRHAGQGENPAVKKGYGNGIGRGGDGDDVDDRGRR